MREPGMHEPNAIRPYRPEDLEAVDRIRREAFRTVFDSFRSILGERVSALALPAFEEEQKAHFASLVACARNCFLRP